MKFLRDQRIEAVPKEVLEIEKDGRFPVVRGVDIRLFAESMADIRERIEKGVPLEADRYRRGSQPDLLLREEGILHLHVNPDIDDDVLLLVGQTDETVVFLALVRHSDVFRPPRFAAGIKRWLARPIANLTVRPRPIRKPDA